MNIRRRRIGVIGGLGALGAADIFFKLVHATSALSGREQFDLMFEQHPFDEPDSAGSEDASLTARKLYVFDMVRSFERRGADAVVLPCFLSHTFLDEVAAETRVPILDARVALVAHVRHRHPDVRRIGVLTSDRARRSRLFERAFEAAGIDVVQPAPQTQRDVLMPAIYGADGLKRGQLQAGSVERIVTACRDLLDQGAELIVPGFTEIPIVMQELRAAGLALVDSNRVYASHAANGEDGARARALKVGVVGGVGPAATADFMQKIVRNTSASRDQEHIKVLVEQNPQIPDRTENLVGDGPDPTVALYATCKKLEAGDADMIAIPCNTAHAYVERIQPYLSIPIVNMLHETVRHLREHHPECRQIGLLATSGTIGSRVYHEALEAAGLVPIAPDETHQALVMDAIYGERGVKAGHTDGPCRDELLAALAHLVARGAQAAILGCTELPLLLEQSSAFAVGDRHVVLLDPSDILARRCVALARQSGRA